MIWRQRGPVNLKRHAGEEVLQRLCHVRVLAGQRDGRRRGQYLLRVQVVLVQRLALEFNHDPIQELVKLAQSNRVSPDLKAKINMEFLQYYLPKLRAIDTNPNQGEVIQINIVNPHEIVDAQIIDR